jgi:hypothetical protein
MVKKLLTFLTLLTLFFGVGWAAETTFTAGTDVSETTTISKDGITITATTFNNASYYQTYANQTMTVASDNSITKIEITCTANNTSNYGPAHYSTNVGSYAYAGKVGTWTGSSKTIVFSAAKQVRMTKIVVTYEAGGSGEQDPVAPSGTITFTPAAGEVTSGTTVEMSFSGTCTGIKYTTNGDTPDATHGTVYNASNPLSITGATTIKAAAYNYSNSKYAFGSVATAEYTVTIPSVDYDGTATFVAGTDVGTSTEQNH